MHVPESASPKLPRSYLWWLFGVIWTLIGMQVLSFGLGWIAAGISGTTAGLVLTAVALPRVVLALVGGTLADRVGAWRVMVVSDLAMFCITATLYFIVATIGSPAWLLIATGAIIGTADAFYRPASGSLPRYLVPMQSMRRATAARQIVIQSISFIGPALGGVFIAWLGLAGSAAAASVGFVLMLVVLITLRHQVPRMTRSPDRSSFLKESREGLNYSMSDPAIRGILLILATVAGFVFPLTTLLVPLMTRQNGWTTVSAGVIAGCYAGGLALASAIFILNKENAIKRLPAVSGILVTGISMVVVAIAPYPAVAGCGAAVAGFGSGLFTAKAAPVLLTKVPNSYLSRVQAVALLGQTLPILLTNNLLGFLGDIWGARETTLACAVVVTAIGIVSLARPSTRSIGRSLD